MDISRVEYVEQTIRRPSTVSFFNNYIHTSCMHASSIKCFLIVISISDLTVAVDIYSDWIDACEASNQQRPTATNNANSTATNGTHDRERRQRISVEEDDDDERDDDDDLDPY